MKIVLEDLKSFFRQLKFTAERKEGVFKSQSLEREREREREREGKIPIKKMNI